MGNKYSRLQISIHWLVFLLVIVAYCAMEFRGFFPRSDRPLINMVPVSCGIAILVLMVVRLLLRLKCPTPPIIPKPKPMMTGLAHLGHLVIYLLFIALPVIGTPPIIPKPKPMMTGLAHWGHVVIYLLFIALPVIGLVMMYNRGNPWFAFGLTMPYASEANFERVDSLKSRHETLANLGYFVIGLHAAAALAHHYFWKDNTLLRMMPRKRS